MYRLKSGADRRQKSYHITINSGFAALWFGEPGDGVNNRRMSDGASMTSMQREKKLVAMNSVAVAVAITILKATVGVATGSLGILSEAAHSGLDLVAAAL